MKTVKKILIGLLIFIVLLLVLAFFLPREINVSASKTMDAPANYVYNIVNDFKNVEKWDPWVAVDETMKFTYGDKTIGEGASYSWSGQSDGKVDMIKSTPGEKIMAKISSPVMGDCDVEYNFTKDGDNKSTMQWDFKAQSSWPMNLMNFFIKKSTKSSFNVGLDNINKIAQTRYSDATYGGYTINEEMIGDKTYIINRGEVALDKIQQFYSRNLGPLFQKIQAAGVEMDGKPSGLFYSYDMAKGVSDMAAGIPISESVAISDASSQNIPAGKAVVAEYYGDYALTGSAHEAIDNYMRDRGLFQNTPVLEEYVTDPSKEKDPEKWLTRIIYYLSE